MLEPGSPERKDRLAIPESVLREVLVNALTHRSYRVASAIQVIRFKDRIEVRNSGHSLVDDERLGEPGSFSRSPRIADVFREMRLAENKGTGIAAMKRAMKLAGLTPPIFQSDRRTDRFIATIWLHNLLGPEEAEWLQGFAGLGLSDSQAQALVIARRTGEVRNSSLRDVTDLDPIQARRELHGLRMHGLLRMESERGGAYYVLDAKAVLSEYGSGEDRSVSDRGEPGLRGELEASDRGELGGEPASGGAPAIPAGLRERLAKLGKKPNKSATRQIILELGALGFWRPGELSAAFRFRDPEKFVERHLTPMVNDGLLVRRYPDSPTHPDQAYRTAQEHLPFDNEEPR